MDYGDCVPPSGGPMFSTDGVPADPADRCGPVATGIAFSPRTSERELASLLDVLSSTFYRCELHRPWRMSFASRGAESITGYPPETFETMGWEKLMHQDDVPNVQQKVAEAIEGRRAFSVIYRLFHRSGEIRWVKEQGHAIYAPDGEAQFLEGMISDVTEEHLLRQANAEAKVAAEGLAQRLLQVLESTSDCVMSFDRDLRISYLNQRAKTELYSAGNLVGRHALEAFPQLEATPFWSAYQQVLTDQKPCRLEAFMPGLDHWYEVNVAPIDDGLTVFFRNIDDRKMAEQALLERETQFRKTLNHIPQMVWSARPDGHHDYYSRLWYEFTGVPEHSTDGEGWNGMFHPDDRERAWERWRRSLGTGEPYEIEYRLRHHSGEYRWLLGRAWPERNEQGEIVRWYGTCTDIHDRVSAQEDLFETRSVQEGVLQSSADCIQIMQPDGSIEFINDPGLSAMELPSLEDVRGQKWLSFWPSEQQATAQQAIDDALANCPSRFSGVCLTASGKPKWWDVVITPIKDERGEISRLLSIARDITAQREAAQELKRASEHDALTALPNRRAFSSHLQAATIRAMHSGGEVALLMIDLDHFKHVNDTLGHAAGDHMLTIFARRLIACVGPSGFVARLGGDEFAIILEGKPGDLDPIALGQAVVERLRQPILFEGRYVSGGASIGGAVFPRDAGSANELFKSADIALYALKESGRGGTRMFHSHMRENAQIVASQLSLARAALSEESIEPHYQPKVELKTGSPAGMEALLRWRHSTRGLQLPDTVSEAFKDYELAAKIGDLMQRRVFRDLRGWLNRKLPVGFVAINAAPAEFLRDDFAERLIARIEEHSVPPSLVEIEVTEHVFLDRGADYVGRALQVLHGAGIRIALDDFGTGHSSLSHLRDYPVDVVKIDRSFIDKIATDGEVHAIVSAVIDLARSLKIDVVAEGIETGEQCRVLIEEGCLLGQGFYFGRAVHADEIPNVLGRNARRLVA